MYKVFINERPFVLSAKPLVLHQGQSVAYQSPAQLKTLLHSFKSSPLSAHSLTIYADDVEALKAVFFSLFSIIEAAGGIVQNPDGHYLFIKRLGLWDLPKGKIDPGEGVEEAALREVEEECGITGLTITANAGQTYHTYEHKGKEVLKITHWFLMESSFTGQLIPQTEEAITEAKWMDKAEVEAVVMPKTYVSIAELVGREIL